MTGKTAVKRLVARYIKANGIDVGRTVNFRDVRIHRYRDHFVVTDLTNAGKRGKKVKVLSVSLGYGSGLSDAERAAWYDDLGKALVSRQNYDDVLGYLDVAKQDQPALYWSIREERGIDVEPTGDKITLKTNFGLEIMAAPNEFRVLNRQPLEHPKTGKPVGFQDTNYYNADKASATVFFTWLQKNLAAVNNMNMGDLRNNWERLNVKYDYH